MEDFEGLAHVRWECQSCDFHPEVLNEGDLRKASGFNRPDFARPLQAEKHWIAEGHAMNACSLWLSNPPKYSVAYTIGFLKGKSALRMHWELMQGHRMTDLHFGTTGS